MATTIKADMEGVICAWVSHQAAACARTLRIRALSSIAVTAPATNKTGAKHKRRSIRAPWASVTTRHGVLPLPPEDVTLLRCSPWKVVEHNCNKVNTIVIKLIVVCESLSPERAPQPRHVCHICIR
jgi:hypothetical protein